MHRRCFYEWTLYSSSRRIDLWEEGRRRRMTMTMTRTRTRTMLRTTIRTTSSYSSSSSSSLLPPPHQPSHLCRLSPSVNIKNQIHFSPHRPTNSLDLHSMSPLSKYPSTHPRLLWDIDVRNVINSYRVFATDCAILNRFL